MTLEDVDVYVDLLREKYRQQPKYFAWEDYFPIKTVV